MMRNCITKFKNNFSVQQ